jgi:Curli production assembly/transport component CsgF.
MSLRHIMQPLFAVGWLVVYPASLLAGDIVYTPVNPSFGGSPLNSSHLHALVAR